MSEISARYQIDKKILFIRGQKVMLDRDLAELYGVGTRDLNKAVSRNKDRFPPDFTFYFSKGELENLMFQFGTSKQGGTRKLPRVFTEQGVAMLSSVLRSKKAIRVNIEIMRAFARLREILAVNRDLAVRLEALERKFNAHDSQFKAVFDAIRELMKEPEKPKRKIGFTVEEKRAVYKV